MNQKPNIIYILTDQLRACSLPNYGLEAVPMPHIEQLGRESITFSNAIATYPLCTPSRSMLFTGRNPQTTGLFVNFTSSRYDEIGMGDVFKHAGYQTGYVGKWHLNRGAFPSKDHCWIPEGRSRLGFDYWRAYNCHTEYFNGSLNKDDWKTEAWEGYETEGLLKYVYEFIESSREQPFLCVLSPHQPHHTLSKHAPDHYYDRLPDDLKLPDNVIPEIKEKIEKDYRDYLAMILAIDDMVGNIMDYLKTHDFLENTILVFTSDHGTQMGAHIDSPTYAGAAWQKRHPYEESIHVPLFIHLPGHQGAGTQNHALITPLDMLPTLCGLTGISIPRTAEGKDLSQNILGKPDAPCQDAVYLMNFANFDYSPDWLPVPGNEWRGVRTLTHTYVKWSNGKTELYDLTKDPLELNNCIDQPDCQETAKEMDQYLQKFMKRFHDNIHPSDYYRSWIDQERRIIRNAYGELSDPESTPDWSLLES